MVKHLLSPGIADTSVTQLWLVSFSFQREVTPQEFPAAGAPTGNWSLLRNFSCSQDPCSTEPVVLIFIGSDLNLTFWSLRDGFSNVSKRQTIQSNALHPVARDTGYAGRRSFR